MRRKLPPIGLRVAKRPLCWKGKLLGAAVFRNDPHTIVISPYDGYVRFYRANPERMLRHLVLVLNHETLHAAMRRIGLREWLAIDRFITYRKEDYRMGLADPENALGFAKDEDDLVRFEVTDYPQQASAGVVEGPPGEREHGDRGDVEQKVVAGRGEEEGQRETAGAQNLGRRQEQVLGLHGPGTTRTKDERSTERVRGS